VPTTQFNVPMQIHGTLGKIENHPRDLINMKRLYQADHQKMVSKSINLQPLYWYGLILLSSWFLPGFMVSSHFLHGFLPGFLLDLIAV
jgi:hypothetical protein